MDGHGKVTGERQSEPVDLSCRTKSSSAVTSYKEEDSGVSEPLDLSITTRTQVNADSMDPYYYYNYPNHHPSSYDHHHGTRQSGYTARTCSVSPEYQRTLPYYWNCMPYSLGSTSPDTRSRHPTPPAKSSCLHEGTSDDDSYSTRPSCVFSERKGVNEFGHWREMYYSELQESSYNMAQGYERTMVLSNGGSCKYSSQYPPEPSPSSPARRTYSGAHYRTPQYRHQKQLQHPQKPPELPPTASARDSSQSEILVSSNKLFTGGCVVSISSKDSEQGTPSTLPPISITDFVFNITPDNTDDCTHTQTDCTQMLSDSSQEPRDSTQKLSDPGTHLKMGLNHISSVCREKPDMDTYPQKLNNNCDHGDDAITSKNDVIQQSPGQSVREKTIKQELDD